MSIRKSNDIPEEDKRALGLLADKVVSAQDAAFDSLALKADEVLGRTLDMLMEVLDDPATETRHKLSAGKVSVAASNHILARRNAREVNREGVVVVLEEQYRIARADAEKIEVDPEGIDEPPALP